MGWSLAGWIALALSNYFVLSMFDTGAPWEAAVLALLATNLAMVVPSSAASIGVFEVAAKASLDRVRRAGRARAELRARAACGEHPAVPFRSARSRSARVGLSGRELVSGPADETAMP